MIAYKISKNANFVRGHQSTSRFLSARRAFFQQQDVLVLLNRAGLLQEAERDLKNDQSLKRIYDKKFLPKYGLNFVNLVDRPTVDVTKLSQGEEQAGIRRALKTIRSCKPKVVCFIGKIAFNKFQRSQKCDWGWQEEIEEGKFICCIFPIRGPASIRVQELKEVKRASGA